jgi:hypothetical protein
MRPTHGTLGGKRIPLSGPDFEALPPEIKALVVVDFGYGPVRPYRQLLETIEEQS